MSNNYPPQNSSYVDLESFKINTLTENQYNAARQAGKIQDDELYLTPKDETVYAPLTGAALQNATVEYSAEYFDTPGQDNSHAIATLGILGTSASQDILEGNINENTDADDELLVTSGQVSTYVNSKILETNEIIDEDDDETENLLVSSGQVSTYINSKILTEDINDQQLDGSPDESKLITSGQANTYVNNKMNSVAIVINEDNTILEPNEIKSLNEDNNQNISIKLNNNAFTINSGNAFYYNVYDDSDNNITDALSSDTLISNQLTTVKQLINYTTIDNLTIDGQKINSAGQTVSIDDELVIIDQDPLLTKTGKTWNLSLENKYAQLASPDFTGIPTAPNFEETNVSNEDKNFQIVNQNELNYVINNILNSGIEDSTIQELLNDYNSFYKIQYIIRGDGTNDTILENTNILDLINTKVDKIPLTVGDTYEYIYTSIIEDENRVDSKIIIGNNSTSIDNGNKIARFNNSAGLYIGMDDDNDSSATTKEYVDNEIEAMGDTKLNTEGGSITGDLAIGGNLTVNNQVLLKSISYGTSLPASGTEGQLFFQLYVEE